MTNETLLEKYQKTHDLHYLDELYWQVDKLLYYFSQKYTSEIDIVWVGFVKAANTYKHGICKFTTYLTRVVFTECMAAKRKKQPEIHFTLDDDTNTEQPLSMAENIKDENNIDPVAWLDWQEIYKKLSERQQKIIRYRLVGYTQKEIAQKLNMSQSNVNRVLIKTKTIFRRSIQND